MNERAYGNCIHCGAPIRPETVKCEYCDSYYRPEDETKAKIDKEWSELTVWGKARTVLVSVCLVLFIAVAIPPLNDMRL
jgi:hypothetical protein